MYFLGIDTSCYTTSIGVVDEMENLILDKRIILKVKPGNRGIRQSEAFFQHIKNLDDLIKEIFNDIKPHEIKAIGISFKPRNVDSSYMPVFYSGLHIGNILKYTLNVPAYLLSHQENHIYAGLWSSKIDIKNPIAVYHVSGGTTELLYVTMDNNKLDIKIIGGSSDLYAGQFIDRVGVSMGLNFPCGAEMDMLSRNAMTDEIVIPVSIRGEYMSFSGPETFVQRLIEKGNYDKASLSKAIFISIAKSIEETLIYSKKNYDWSEVLLIGGVTSNSVIKEYLKSSKRLKTFNINVIFAQKEYATDNAIGGAVYARKCYRRG